MNTVIIIQISLSKKSAPGFPGAVNSLVCLVAQGFFPGLDHLAIALFEGLGHQIDLREDVLYLPLMIGDGLPDRLFGLLAQAGLAEHVHQVPFGMCLLKCLGGEFFQLLEHFRHHALPNLQVSRFNIHAVDGFGARGAHAQVVMVIPVLITKLHFHQFVADPAEIIDLQTSNFQSLCAGMIGQVEVVINECFFRLQRRVRIRSSSVRGGVRGGSKGLPKPRQIDQFVPDFLK